MVGLLDENAEDLAVRAPERWGPISATMIWVGTERVMTSPVLGVL